jgi:hypothetical protein
MCVWFRYISLYNQICTVNREILVIVLFWPILAPKYKVPKLNTPKYVTLQKLAANYDIISNNELSLIVKIIGQCDVKP